jgi:hypothetical protein
MNRWMLMLGLGCGVTLTVAAQDTPLHKRVTVVYRGIPVAEALRDLGTKAGVRFDCPEKLLEGADLVTCEVKDQEAGRLLCGILRPRGLKLAKTEGSQVTVAQSDRLDEFRVKREESFEFAEKPKVTREGDRVTIAFTTRGWCDVTVAIENADGRIVRHLASGVLGENAPEPFQWNAKKQVLTWDSKNDKGEYVEDKDGAVVRVSLGLKPAYEQPLFWSPYKRFGSYAPVMCATPEGVYVSEGYTVDTVRLFDHEGNYVRTIYPFPAGKLNQVVGLERQNALQTGQPLPRKLGTHQATLLTSGNSCIVRNDLKFGGGIAATAMAVHGERIALAFLNLNRLKTDGSTGGLPLKGPATGFVVPGGTLPYQGEPLELGPTSAAFSPDGKTLYLTGYVLVSWSGYSRQGVYKIAYEKDTAAEVFAGNMDANGYGDDNAHFAVPNAVACDAQGRVYVADYLNNRVQVYAPDGKHLKTISTPLPAKVQIDPRTQEIYVYSWHISTGISNDLVRKYKVPDGDTLKKYKPILTRFGPFEDPKLLGQCGLPVEMAGKDQQQSWMGQLLHVEMDFWAKQPTLWMVGRKYQVNLAQIGHLGAGVALGQTKDDATNTGIQLLVRDGDQWNRVRSFGEQAQKAVARLKPPDFGIQRLSANEKTHKLYLLEHNGFGKCNDVLIEIDPQTGKCRAVPIPLATEDICFDQDGYIYLRTYNEVGRYDPRTWREIPWDYGEERPNARSALPLPDTSPGYHHGGLWISPKGHLAVACFNGAVPPDKIGARATTPGGAGKPYTPLLYPGRLRLGEIHIWDTHGKPIRDDAVPGLGTIDGLGIDKDDNLYAMFRAPRNYDNKPYPPHWIWEGTVIKFKARDANPAGVRVLTVGSGKGDGYGVPLPLPEAEVPPRPPDTLRGGDYGTFHGKTWMTGAEWFYSGCGIVGAGCSCYHTRFQMDGFARSFAPEPDLYSVAVLDSNGNLITRVGQYGNTDDGVPMANAERGMRSAELGKDESGGPSLPTPHSALRIPHSIGGDEVPLLYPAYVGVDTDRRLFVSDIGNARIVSVQLGYHADARVALKDAGD